MSDPLVLSYVSARPLTSAWQAGRERATASFDLGLSTCSVRLLEEGVELPDGGLLPWAALGRIAESDTACFEVNAGQAVKIQAFSEAFGRFYSLMPTQRAPTMMISGVLMHRIKDVDPHEDTLRKIRAVSPIRGAVLDTCTGLGYTAIEAARTADRVVTIEIDPTALEIARRNPWSVALFEDRRIEQLVGDAFDVVATLDSQAFARIIHDPPTFSLAGDLYSSALYVQLHRVLARRGRMFHYIGDLSSRSGRNVARGASRRLTEAGFSRVSDRPDAFGLVAYK